MQLYMDGLAALRSLSHHLYRQPVPSSRVQGQTVLEGKAGMAAALSVMGSSAVSLPALAALPHCGPSMQRPIEEAESGVDSGAPSILHPGTPRMRVLGGHVAPQYSY